MIACPNCKREMVATAAFCPHCGAHGPNSRQAEVESEIRQILFSTRKEEIALHPKCQPYVELSALSPNEPNPIKCVFYGVFRDVQDFNSYRDRLRKRIDKRGGDDYLKETLGTVYCVRSLDGEILGLPELVKEREKKCQETDRKLIDTMVIAIPLGLLLSGCTAIAFGWPGFLGTIFVLVLLECVCGILRAVLA
jgi:hypothetical protein